MNPIERFQQLLRELFQFDCADLDFGIYRIMNYKRDVIEKFITRDLPKAVAEDLDSGALADQSQAAAELKEVVEKIRETLGSKAIDADGRLAEAYHGTPLGEKYLSLRAKTAGGRSREALEAAIFNHLYTFFSRYYQDGDFISKRRYSKRQKYAIPYNGEEVYLYWANHDQYYVKTAEHFHDYTFSARGVTVHFKLKAANVEQNNIKGDKRFFLPIVKEIAWDEATSELVIPFEYRPLTEQEAISYGTKQQQDAIIAEALRRIPEKLSGKATAVALAALTAERRKSANGSTVTFLEHHLRQYTRRNTSDFFIHKNLQGFLSRELDFYLKNEVLNLDEIESAGEMRAEGWFQMMRVIKSVGSRIIEFLHQIEEFQKMLWEKRKFVTDTQYCITVGNIDERFYPEIAACEAQWDEWKELFHIDEEQSDIFTNGKNRRDKRVAFLKAHPTLVLDTKHFDANLVDRLLVRITDLEGNTDGLLIHSENYQALGLLLESYREKVRCIYIDPPYNTDASSILYKNDYKDSSWLAMIVDRVRIAISFMVEIGIVCVAIDDEEFIGLKFILDEILKRRLGISVVRSNPAGRKTKGKLAPAHEYALFYAMNDLTIPGSLEKTAKGLSRYPLSDETSRFAWANFVRSGSNDRREDRPKLFYPIFVNKNNCIRVPKMEWDSMTNEYRLLESPSENEEIVFPRGIKNGKLVDKNWHRGHIRLSSELSEYRVRRSETGEISIDFKTRMDEDSLPITWWDRNEYASANYGAAELKDLFGEKAFDFSKSRHLIEDCLKVCRLDNDYEIALDFFAGSGTTAHAIINMNYKDGERRGFILVEMANYFDTVLLPRIKKVTFSPEWKEGKPKRMATAEEAERSPRIIKYIRLESYEDALNNISLDESSNQQAMEFDDYLLKYMLKWEARQSETLLNIAMLTKPFSYKLRIYSNGETREKSVDIPETFNYLLGLHVQTRKVYYDEERRYLVYRGRIDHRQIVVIWRETEGWTKEDFERDKKFVSEQKLTEGVDEVFVNGNSFIPNARALEPIFKARMFAPVEA